MIVLNQWMVPVLVPDRVLVLHELLAQIQQVRAPGDPVGRLASLEAEYRLLRGGL